MASLSNERGESITRRWKWKFWERRSADDSWRSYWRRPRDDGATYVATDRAVLNSNVYTVASVLGGDIGKFPFQVFKRQGSSIKRDNKHPVSRLISKKANPYMTAYIFKETMMVNMIVWGNAYANIEFDGNGYPKALWPLDPARTEIYLTAAGDVYYITQLPNGTLRKLWPDEVLHFKALGNGLKGITPIEVIREELGVQKAQKSFLGRFYNKGTNISGILDVESDVPLSPAAKDIIRTEFEKATSGMDNAARVAVMDKTMKYTPLGMPLKDAQFIESSRFGIAEVAKIYKVPGYKLGISDVKYSNMENQSLEYVKNTLQPLVTNCEQEMDDKLFTQIEQEKYYIKANMTSELRGDMTTRANYYKTMMEAGVYSINEVRAMEDEDGIGPDGDKHFVSLNFVNLANMDEYQNAKAGVKGGDDDQKGDKVPPDDPTGDAGGGG